MVFTFGTPLSYGIFREPFSEAFGISPVALSTVFSVMLFAFFIGSGVIGVLGVRLPARGILLACAATTGFVAPALYVVDSYLGLFVVFGLLGLALGTAFVLVASVVPRWFEQHRGAATGLIFVGNGLGLFIFPPLWQLAFDAYSVEQAFGLIIGTTAVGFLLAGLVCKRPDWVDHSTDSVGEMVEWSVGLAGDRQFQYLFVGMGLAFAWYHLLAAFAVDLFSARGLSAVGASTAFGLIGGVSIISRIASGYLADRIGSRRAFLGALAGSAVGIALLVAPPVPVVAIGVVLIGLGLGGCATLYIPLLLEVYPPEMDSAVVGMFNISAGIGSLAMPPLGTASIAYTESYTAALALTCAVTLAGLWLVIAGTRPTAAAGG